MAKYILGIDTTFHASGVGLVDENGKVIMNKIINADFMDEHAEKFFNFHNKNILSLVKPILDQYSDDIFLISASSLEGTFHAMPVGAIIANAISYFSNKDVVGISHEIAHLHANWLDRKESDFIFPIVSLNISGAHSNIYLIKSIQETERISEILWREEDEKFGGLGALFGTVCQLLDIKVKRGEGGPYLEKLASSGKLIYRQEFNDLSFRREDDNFNFVNIKSYIYKKLGDLNYYSLRGESLEEFKKDFASSLLDVLFDSLIAAISSIADENKAKEIHLSGGIAANRIFKSKLEGFCKNNNLKFKSPLKLEFSGDNGAMAAISGYFKWKYHGSNVNEKFICIKPSNWYYKYYVKYFV